MISIGRALAVLHGLAVTALVTAGCTTGIGGIDSGTLRSSGPGNAYVSALAARLDLAGQRPGRAGGPTPPVLAASARAVVEARSGTLATAWRTARETYHLAPPGADWGDRPFAFSGGQAVRVEVELVPVGGTYYRLEFACDGELTALGPNGGGSHLPRRPITLSSSGGSDKATRLVLIPSAQLTRCDGFAHFTAGSRPFRMVRQEVADPRLARADAAYQECVLPSLATDDPIANAFYSAGWLSETCPFVLPRENLLETSRTGFDAKVKALLGTDLPAQFYERGDPGLPLDFSRAPSLALAVISYLDVKADFSGKVLDRLLRHHAARGTPIRILASSVLERDKDRAMLEQLAADYPNVSYKVHLWSAPPGSGPIDALAQFHRVNHVKLLAAISSDPRRSVAIVGGRNIHDGFLFDHPLDLSAYPALHQYGQARSLGLNYYSNWRDLDIAIHDDRTARLLAAQVSTLSQDDASTRVVRPFSIAARGTAAPREGYARHFLSVPYADGRALEDYYVSLFDAARSRIDIVNPYLNFTDRLRLSLERALARGVAVTIVGRISLEGDLGGKLMTAINEEFVERYFRRIRIFDYRDPHVLLHAKILSIDGRLTVLSGVNLNNRSFIHDTENGLVVFDRQFSRRVAAVADEFRRGSDLVTRPPKDRLLGLLLLVRTLREAL
jgi:phosphatidylserine/phosphatidylglycerophosphate/cardiolipin synthase-like enzyme